jgi:hypothetical protein
MAYSTAEIICKEWKISEDEYWKLEKAFGLLCEKQAWELLRKNYRNNHTDEQTDIAQDMRMAMIRAGSYHKRQTYIEKCLRLCQEHVQGEGKFLKSVVRALVKLWKNKTRHGAGRQKFGPHQEKLLYRLTRQLVPKNNRPSKKAPLQMDSNFATYCKSITWNEMKAKGKKITREKVIRGNMASLSEYDFLGGTEL